MLRLILLSCFYIVPPILDKIIDLIYINKLVSHIIVIYDILVNVKEILS